MRLLCRGTHIYTSKRNPNLHITKADHKQHRGSSETGKIWGLGLVLVWELHAGRSGALIPHLSQLVGRHQREKQMQQNKKIMHLDYLFVCLRVSDVAQNKSGNTQSPVHIHNAYPVLLYSPLFSALVIKFTLVE